MAKRRKRKLATTAGMVKPTPATVLAWEGTWKAERHGVDTDSVEARALELSKRTKPPAFDKAR